MTEHLLAVSILAISLGSCGPALTAPKQPVVATTTHVVTFSPTITPTLTSSATPTATSYPPLQTQGPYLLFTRDNKNLTIIDADGVGRKQIQIPNNGYIFQLQRSISPNGKWLAYFTGSIEEPYDVTLNLLNFSDESTHSVSNLLASDFPENLESILETMSLGDPPVFDPDCFEDIECRRSRVQRELTDSIYSFTWSPDNQSIAFTAQIDGPSSDIYIYTLPDKTIRQFTNELENIYSLDWAPNGDSILYKINSVPGLGYEGSEWRLINPEGIPIPFSEDPSPEPFRWDGVDWLSENLYLLLLFSDVDPSFSHFRVLNTDTGQVKEIWSDHAYSYAVNKENKTVVLIHKTFQAQPSTTPDGIYMVYPDGKNSKVSDVGYYFLVFEGQKQYPIFVEDYNTQIHTMDNDGSISVLPWSSIPWISPDGKLSLLKEGLTLALYDDAYQLLNSWEMADGLYNITWSPNSLGFFIFTTINVYYLSITSDTPHALLVNCPTEHCEPVRFVWLP